MPTQKTRQRPGSAKTAASSRAQQRPGASRTASKARAASRGKMAPSTVLVVNMIPKSLSSETNQDSEPHLTVNPANPRQIAGTAFTPNPAGGATAPIFVSADSGNSWVLNATVPGGTSTHDITTSFSRASGKLYSGILKASNSNLDFLRANNFSAPTPMTVLGDRPNADQPFTHATTVPNGANQGKDRLYIGDNDFNAPGGHTATIDQSLNAGGAAPAFTSVRIEKRATVGQDGPQIRPVSHSDGTVYAAFYRWRTLTGNFQANTLVITSTDVVVVRDDKWGEGANPFTALVDPGDGLAGRRVVQGVSFPFMIQGTAATGQQRLGGSLSIAVDPRNSSTVYLAWGDKQPNSILTLHVRRSTDRGVTWSAADLLTVPNATNAALAINSDGSVGFLFQQLRGTSLSRRWVTRLQRSQDGIQWSDLVLANTPANTPGKTFDPYLGDYDHLVAIGKDFYGIFSANNTPNRANFPSGVKYQRNANFTTHTLLRLDNTTPVSASIDPFFFKVTG